MSIFFQCWWAHFSSWDNFVLLDQKRTALQNCCWWHWAFKNAYRNSKAYLPNNLLLTVPLGRKGWCPTPVLSFCVFILRKESMFRITLPAWWTTFVHRALPVLWLVLWGRIHSSNSYLASSVQPKEWEGFCLSNQVCSLHFVSWLCETNTDIDILLDLKTVAEKDRNEKE